jgi:hypothetical protein
MRKTTCVPCTLLALATGMLAQALAPAQVTPAAGSGIAQTFTFTFSGQNLTVVNVLFNSVLDGRRACYIAFTPPGSLFLVNDAGDAYTLNNSQCGISNSSVSITGNTLTFSVDITFTSAFAGNQVIYMAARTAAANSGWQALGTWNVPGPAISGPTVVDMSPPSSAGLSQTYTFTFADSRGWQEISVADVLIASAIDSIGACYVAFVPTNGSAGALLLVDDAGDAGGPYSGAVIPPIADALSLTNSQCSIDPSRSSAIATGATLTLTLSIAFKAGFLGNRIVYAAARSATLSSGWQAVGTTAVRDTDAPILTAIDPNSAPAGSPTTMLTVTGSHFSLPAPCAQVCGLRCPGASIVVFDHTEVETQYIGPTQLRAFVPAPLLATPRTAEVAARNQINIECVRTESHDSTPALFSVQ